MHPHEATTYAIVALAVVVLGGTGYLFWRNRYNPGSLEMDEEKLLYMLKGMTPARFEEEMANMFTALGYRTELTGGAGDGGIDVVAEKNGKKYFIQCKKFITQEVTPHDVRDFLGAITNVNNPAERGLLHHHKQVHYRRGASRGRKCTHRAHRWPQTRELLQNGAGQNAL